MRHRHFGVILLLPLFYFISCAVSVAQTATYHLHKEASGINTSFDKLLVIGPDAAVVSLTNSLTGKSAGEYVIKEFETQSGMPNASGVIPGGSTLSFSLWMRKTANVGTVFPRAKIRLNNASGTLLCTATGTTGLTTTLLQQNFSCTIPANISMAASDRFYLWVGVNLTATSSTSFSGELDIEGVANGNFDSQVTLPLPTGAPTIASLTPNAGAIGSTVVITGTNFRSAQGSSTVKFNGTAAVSSNWSSTSISAAVPTGATSGPVVVTVGGQASTGLAFTVTPPPNIISVTPNSGAVGSSITITGSNFGASQGTGSMRFNGVTASVTSWSAASIVAQVPAGATTGNVVVTAAGGVSSNGVSFTVTPPPGIGSLNPSAGVVGSSVTITGSNFGALPGSVTFNGTAATVITWSANSIVTQVPAGAMTGNVVVTAPGGVSSNGVSFTVIPTPGISGLSPNSGAPGIMVTISGANFGTTQGSGGVTFNGAAATITSWSDTGIVAQIPAGATTGPVVVTAASGAVSAGIGFPVINPSGVNVDQVASVDQVCGSIINGPTGPTTPLFSTRAANELLLAFISTNGNTVSGVSGGGLSWTLVQRTSTRGGTAEIWRAFAPAVLNNVTVSAAAGCPTANDAEETSLTVVSFLGTDLSGTNGSGAIGAVGTANAATGAPAASLTTTRSNSLVFGVGTEPLNSARVAVGANQTIVHQFVSLCASASTCGALAGTFWVQQIDTAVGNSGTTVTLNDSAPTTNPWEISMVEVRPSVTPATAPILTSLSAVSGPVGSTLTISGANFGNPQGTSTVTFNGVAATPTNWSPTSIVVPVPTAATSGNVVVTVGGQASNSLPFIVSNAGGLAIDQIVSQDALLSLIPQIIPSPPFSTTSGNELLLAFIESGSSGATVNSVAGAGLTWTLVKRTTTQQGTAEIWRAFSPYILNNVSVMAAFSTNTASDGSLTVVSYLGTDHSGANGSGAIGAIAGASAATGAPTVSLTTTRANSLVFAAGDDPATAIARTPGPNQAIVHQLVNVCVPTPIHLCTQNHDTLWVQQVTGGIANSGTRVTINDTAPTGDPFNLSAVEILSSSVPVIATISPVAGPVGKVVIISGSNFGGNQGTSTVTFGGIAATATSWSDSSIVTLVPGGLPLGPAPVVVTTAAGASSTAKFTVITPLTITASASPTPNANSWNNTPVTVTFTCSGGLAPVQCNPQQQVVNKDGASQVVTGTATDALGQTVTTSVTLNVEITPPTITTVASPPPNSAGWNNTPVTVTFHCTPSVSQMSPCPGSQSMSSEGANQIVTGTVTDAAGNSITATLPLNIDLTVPEITTTLSPPPSLRGVSLAPVSVNFVCYDRVSGVAQCPAPVTITAPGVSPLITGEVVDKAGNRATTSLSVNVESSPLAISASIAPTPNAAGWNTTPVTVTFTCTGGVPPLQCPIPKTVVNDGQSQLVTSTATDSTGAAVSTSATVNLDQMAPTLNITSPINNNLTSNQVTIQGLFFDSSPGSGISGITCNGAPATFTGAAFTCGVSLNPGTNSIPIVATDIAGNVTTLNLPLSLVTPIHVQITSPTELQLFSANPITVTGTVDVPNATVTVGNITATVSSGVFTASGVSLREAKNLLTVAATTPNGGAGSDTVTVFLDTTPPVIHIENLQDGAVVTTPQIDVAGNVNDLVSGTVNGDQVSVSVNGVTAAIANRSFGAHNILLVPGLNTITATATDRAGNTSQHQIHVTLQQIPGQQQLMVLSGSGQSGPISTVLPQPLVVKAVDGIGRPVPNAALTFSVTRSDGVLMAFPSQSRNVVVQTDANGEAAVKFQLGSRNGVGINQVSVTAPGFAGQVVFLEDSTVGGPAQIHTVSGENQTGVVGEPLPEPLVAIVFDAGGNPLANVPVTFTVQSGGGLVGGQTAFTQNTDADGKANAVLVLGQQEGVNNNTVTASFSGDADQPAVFLSSSVLAGPVANTSVSGIVLDDANQPIPNARASIEGTRLAATTGNDGRFTIPGAPAGNIVLFVDGSTSTKLESFPTLSFQMATIPGIDNTLGHPIFLPQIDTNNSKVVGGDQPVQLTMTGVPGLVYTVAPHSATFPDGSHVNRVTLSQVHADKVPMTPPNGTAPRLVATLQPAGVIFNPPIQMQLPNTDGLMPGQVVEIFSFHHDVEQFVTEGTAHVSDDGSVITTDPGFGLTVSGWHGGGGTPPKSQCVNNCASNDPCNGGGACVNGQCVFSKQATDGGACSLPGNNCGGGTCSHGECVSSASSALQCDSDGDNDGDDDNDNDDDCSKKIGSITVKVNNTPAPQLQSQIGGPDPIVFAATVGFPAHFSVDFGATDKDACDQSKLNYLWEFNEPNPQSNDPDCSDSSSQEGTGLSAVDHTYCIGGSKYNLKLTVKCGKCTAPAQLYDKQTDEYGDVGANPVTVPVTAVRVQVIPNDGSSLDPIFSTDNPMLPMQLQDPLNIGKDGKNPDKTPNAHHRRFYLKFTPDTPAVEKVASETQFYPSGGLAVLLPTPVPTPTPIATATPTATPLPSPPPAENGEPPNPPIFDFLTALMDHVLEELINNATIFPDAPITHTNKDGSVDVVRSDVAGSSTWGNLNLAAPKGIVLFEVHALDNANPSNRAGDSYVRIVIGNQSAVQDPKYETDFEFYQPFSIVVPDHIAQPYPTPSTSTAVGGNIVVNNDPSHPSTPVAASLWPPTDVNTITTDALTNQVGLVTAYELSIPGVEIVDQLCSQADEQNHKCPAMGEIYHGTPITYQYNFAGSLPFLVDMLHQNSDQSPTYNDFIANATPWDCSNPPSPDPLDTSCTNVPINFPRCYVTDAGSCLQKAWPGMKTMPMHQFSCLTQSITVFLDGLELPTKINRLITASGTNTIRVDWGTPLCQPFQPVTNKAP